MKIKMIDYCTSVEYINNIFPLTHSIGAVIYRPVMTKGFLSWREERKMNIKNIFSVVLKTALEEACRQIAYDIQLKANRKYNKYHARLEAWRIAGYE